MISQWGTKKNSFFSTSSLGKDQNWKIINEDTYLHFIENSISRYHYNSFRLHSHIHPHFFFTFLFLSHFISSLSSFLFLFHLPRIFSIFSFCIFFHSFSFLIKSFPFLKWPTNYYLNCFRLNITPFRVYWLLLLGAPDTLFYALLLLHYVFLSDFAVTVFLSFTCYYCFPASPL